MARLKDLIINNQAYTLYEFTGTVMSEKTWSETRVHGSGGGGGGSFYQGTGTTAPVSVRISSTVTRKDVFVLRDSEKNEDDFEFVDMQINVRVGHVVTCVWAIPRGKSSGPFWLVYNHTTGKIHRPNGFDDAFRFPRWHYLVAGAAGMGGAYVLSPLFAVSGDFSYYALLALVPASAWRLGYYGFFGRQSRKTFLASKTHQDLMEDVKALGQRHVPPMAVEAA